MPSRYNAPMIGTPEQDAFLRKNFWATLVTIRKDGRASSSVVVFGTDGDDLLVSTRSVFGKVRMLERDSRVTLTSLAGPPTWDFVTVEGACAIERDLKAIEAPTRKVFEAMGRPAPDDLAGWLSSQGRVILRITPERLYDRISPPRPGS
jgi:PPOX class probable F420-dependent enzyme